MRRLTPFFSVLLLITLIVPASFVLAREDVPETPSSSELRAQYAEAAAGGDKVRILVMPGHEPTYGGAQFQGFYEREIVVEIADDLAAYLESDPNYEVIVARDKTSWNEDLEDYFDDEWDEIEDFVEDKKRETERLVRRGKVSEQEDGEKVDHNAAPSDVALRLYGINKWANENEIDLVVHAHVNDATDHTEETRSAYSGLTIYVPEGQYDNSETSKDIAEDIFSKVNFIQATSTLPVEDQGIVEDQELIAIGAYGTLGVPSVLMEYGYITEPKLTELPVRDAVTRDYAYTTYLGIQDFFDAPAPVGFKTSALPFTFTKTPTVGSSSPEAYALQGALKTLGFYPAATTTIATSTGMATTTTTRMRTLTECPISGFMDECTTSAVAAFQQSKGWSGTGELGPQTLQALNTQFASVPIIPVPVVTAPPTINTSIATPVTAPPTINTSIATPVTAATTTASTSVATPAITTTTTASTSVAVSATSACSLTRNLAEGSTDADSAGEVSTIQRVLAEDTTVYPEGLITGFYGPSTTKAVAAFQAKNSIAAVGEPGSGKVGPKTRTALLTQCK